MPAIFTGIRMAGYPVEIVDLRYNSDKPLSNTHVYIRATRWIVEKSDVLAAVQYQRRMSRATDEWTSGGTGHSEVRREPLDKSGYPGIDPLVEPHQRL